MRSAPRETGYAVIALPAGPEETRLLYMTEDDPKQLPTHKQLHSLVQGEEHLYYMDPNWTADLKGGIDISRWLGRSRRRWPSRPAQIARSLL